VIAKRILVCGGRDYRDGCALFGALDALEHDHGEIMIIQGGATGADQLARHYAWRKGIEFWNYPADWKAHGKAAGPIRNQRMIDDGKPDLVLAAPGGKGTADMIARATKAGIPIQHVLNSDGDVRDASKGGSAT
jgi:hypothetical protein